MPLKQYIHQQDDVMQDSIVEVFRRACLENKIPKIV